MEGGRLYDGGDAGLVGKLEGGTPGRWREGGTGRPLAPIEK
jgi:hypothetical protein